MKDMNEWLTKITDPSKREFFDGLKRLNKRTVKDDDDWFNNSLLQNTIYLHL